MNSRRALSAPHHTVTGPATTQAVTVAASTPLFRAAQRRHVVSALSRQAAQFAREAGQRLWQPVQQDLKRRCAPYSRIRAQPISGLGGRPPGQCFLPSQFRQDGAPAAKTPGTRSRPESPAASRGRSSTDELAEWRRARQEQLARAEEVSEAAQQRLREERACQAVVDAELRRARERTEQARRRMSAIKEEIQQSREECRQAEDAQQEAEKHSRSAADVLAQAEGRHTRSRSRYAA